MRFIQVDDNMIQRFAKLRNYYSISNFRIMLTFISTRIFFLLIIMVYEEEIKQDKNRFVIVMYFCTTIQKIVITKSLYFRRFGFGNCAWSWFHSISRSSWSWWRVL